MRRNVPAVDEILDKKFPCLDHGFVALVDYMGDDQAIVEAARNSIGAPEAGRKLSDDVSLIRYLMSHEHMTPFEMVETKWCMKLPIFVARQIIRHRTASVNELSGRYSILPEEFYIPEIPRFQSSDRRQGAGENIPVIVGGHIQDEIQLAGGIAFGLYHELLGIPDPDTADHEVLINGYNTIRGGGGMAREQARTVLPISTYTQWYWKIDLRNLFHFLRLRTDMSAQEEVRVYANQMVAIVEKLVPIAWEAFNDFCVDTVVLSRRDRIALINRIAGMRDITCFPTEREAKDFEHKMYKLGLTQLLAKE